MIQINSGSGGNAREDSRVKQVVAIDLRAGSRCETARDINRPRLPYARQSHGHCRKQKRQPAMIASEIRQKSQDRHEHQGDVSGSLQTIE